MDWRREAILTANLLAERIGEQGRYEACAGSDGSRRYLHIYDLVAGDTKLSLSAPTYHDLYLAAQFALNVHRMIERGF